MKLLIKITAILVLFSQGVMADNYLAGKQLKRFFTAFYNDDFEEIKQMLKEGVDPRLRYSEQANVLNDIPEARVHEIYTGKPTYPEMSETQLEILQYLFDRGLEVNLMGDVTSSPLRVALTGTTRVYFESCNYSYVKILLENGADFKYGTQSVRRLWPAFHGMTPVCGKRTVDLILSKKPDFLGLKYCGSDESYSLNEEMREDIRRETNERWTAWDHFFFHFEKRYGAPNQFDDEIGFIKFLEECSGRTWNPPTF